MHADAAVVVRVWLAACECGAYASGCNGGLEDAYVQRASLFERCFVSHRQDSAAVLQYQEKHLSDEDVEGSACGGGRRLEY